MRFINIVSVLSLCVFSLVQAQTPEIAEYPFIKKINIPAVSVDQKVVFDLDEATLNDINTRFSNVGIYNTDNESIPFTVMHEPPARVKQITITDISSAKDDNDPTWLFDQDITTTFAFDKRIDKKNPATVTIDLGTPKRLNRIEVFVPETARIYKMALFGGNDPDQLDKIMSDRPFNWQIDFRSEPVQYLQIALWGFRVDVNDIRLSHSHTGKLFFTATNSDQNLVLAYGGPRDHITYISRVGSNQVVDAEATLGNQTWNDLFAADIDTDGIQNEIDNCPFVNNRGQSDRDGDTIGDACDNAINTKNYDQSDIDKDGVGDLIDNCKIKPNPNQRNADGDKFGDVCDVAFNDPNLVDNNQNVSFNKNTILYTLLSILAVFLLGYVYYMNRKK